MADVKWIKMSTEVFDNRKIRQIEAMPEGDSIIVIWFKLLCLAGCVNDKGYIYITQEVAYTEQTLAVQFNRPLTTVQLALKVLEEFGMIEVIDDILCISNWEKYQSIEKLEKMREQTRQRVAKYRENQKKLECNVTCNADVTQCNATDKDIDIDIDKDIDIDINKDIENKIIYLLSSSKNIYIGMKLENEFNEALKMMIKAAQVTKVIPDQGRLEDLMKEIIFNREDVSNKQGYLVECFKHEGGL